jgi:DHA1 family bicyclomycin/chloramphenicol resistance-like MFS transporter
LGLARAGRGSDKAAPEPPAMNQHRSAESRLTAAPMHSPMGFAEFVALVASLMALNALAIDVMLPALPDIGAALDVIEENDRQRVLSSYLIGFGVGQLLIGSISDRFGRKAVLLWGLAVYVFAAGLCAVAPSFELLLAARFLHGLGSAAPRVITTSVVRDCYGGRAMASVMSLAMMVFMAVPVLAPSIGQLIILFAPWRAIFALLTGYGLFVAVWVTLRLPETLPAAKRRAIGPRQTFDAFRQVLTTRQSLGYALAGGMMFGALFGFLISAQQVFTEIFGLGAYFPLAFAAVALAMSVSSFINAKLVGRFGMRVMSHGAVAVFTGISALFALLAFFDALGLVAFMILLGGVMFLVGMIFSNFNALAMEPQGHVAGTASSLFGSITTLIAASIGSIVGHAYDGTLVPLSSGFLVLGTVTLGIIAVTEKGRLFRVMG